MIETLITSSVLIAALIIIRTVFKGRLRSTVRYSLWLIAVIRLMMPAGLTESPLSIMNFVSGEESGIISHEEQDNELFPVSSGKDPAVRYEGGAFSTAAAPTFKPTVENAGTRETDRGSRLSAVKTVWLFTGSLMLLWFAVINGLFYRELIRTRCRVNFPCPLPVYTSESITTPCIFGLLHPAIYIPEEMSGNSDALTYVTAHELCHYRHGDLIWAAVRCLLLSVYWFNPLVWAAAVLSKRDCECACDEAAIRLLGEDKRFAYGKTIIDLIPVKNDGVFGAVSAMMASSKKVLRERMKLIAHKSGNKPGAVLVAAAALLTVSCTTFTSAAENAPAVEKPVSLPSDLKQQDGIIGAEAVSCEGSPLFLSYIAPPDKEHEAFLSAEGAFSPAARSEELTAEKLSELAGSFSRAELTFSGKTKTFSAYNGTLYDLNDLICGLDHGDTTEEIGEEPFAQIIYSRENGGFSSRLEVYFYKHDEGLACRITADDYSDLVSLAVEGDAHITSDDLKNAYVTSTAFDSGYRFADMGVYDKLSELADENTVAGILVGDTASENVFFGEMSAVTGIAGIIPEGYVPVHQGEIAFALPDEGTLNSIGGLLLWQNGRESMHISQTDTVPEDMPYAGSFCGRECFFRQDGECSELIISDSSGNYYSAVYEGAINNAEAVFATFHLMNGEDSYV